ncbi:hypothetical protein M9X92_009448 [Pyricularia oryzae]|nr:hypothetical protein M9X92_009448 [Pyricularia oryzae]
MQRFFFPGRKPQSRRRSSSQGQTASSNTPNVSSSTGHHHRGGQQHSGRSGSSSSSRRHSLSSTVDLSNPFLMQHQEVESPVGPLPPSGSGPGPTPLDTSIQMTIIDDTVTEGRPLFYVMTCSLDTIKFSTIGIPSMNLCSTKALDNFVRHGYSVTVEIGWKTPSPYRYF